MRQKVAVAFRFTEFGFEADHHRHLHLLGGKGVIRQDAPGSILGCFPPSRTALKKMPPLTEGEVFFD